MKLSVQLVGALALVASHGARAAEASVPPPDTVRVLLKFVPEKRGGANGGVRFVPQSCPACVQLHDPAYERFDRKESIVELAVPRDRHIELQFEAPPSQARRVLLNQSDLDTRRMGGRLTVALPPLRGDAIWAAALSTEFVEPGLTLRFEHADVDRRAGPYAQGRFPVTERRAADNLTFAQREVIRRLGLGQYVEEQKVGKIMLMGFDTNYPAGHKDAPPHIHMHLRWANNVGTQIGHYYLTPDGVLDYNRVGVSGLHMPTKTFDKGQTFTTIDRQGRAVYSHTITPEGWLVIGRPDGARCQLRPRTHGFDSGVLIDCGALGQTDIEVQDDQQGGIMTVKTGNIVELFRYDLDSGALASPEELAVPPSTVNPEE